MLFFCFSFSCRQPARKNRGVIPAVPFLLLLFLLSGSAMGAETLPPPVNRLLYQVSMLYRHGEYAKASELVRNFRKQAGKYADHTDVLLAQANCCLAMQKYQCAVQSYRKVVLSKPDCGPAWQNMAGALYHLQNYAEAARGFQRAFDLQKQKKPELLYYTGLCLLMAGEGHEARVVLKRLFRQFPSDITPEWKEAMARALIADNHGREALPLLRELVSTYTGEQKKQWSEFLLYQYIQLDMNSRALAFAHDLARTYPLEDRWWKGVVRAALKQEDMEDAVMALTIISFMRPLDRQEARLLAGLNLYVDIPVKAIPIYEKLMSEKPSPELLKYVVYAYTKLGHLDSALHLFEKYGEVTARDEHLILMHADILYSMSRYKEALSVYLRAASRGKHKERNKIYSLSKRERGRAWLMAGYCACQVDDFVTADHAFSMAAGFASQRKQALKALRFVESRYAANPNNRSN